MSSEHTGLFWKMLQTDDDPEDDLENDLENSIDTLRLYKPADPAPAASERRRSLLAAIGETAKLHRLRERVEVSAILAEVKVGADAINTYSNFTGLPAPREVVAQFVSGYNDKVGQAIALLKRGGVARDVIARLERWLSDNVCAMAQRAGVQMSPGTPAPEGLEARFDAVCQAMVKANHQRLDVLRVLTLRDSAELRAEVARRAEVVAAEAQSLRVLDESAPPRHSAALALALLGALPVPAAGVDMSALTTAAAAADAAAEAVAIDIRGGKTRSAPLNDMCDAVALLALTARAYVKARPPAEARDPIDFSDLVRSL